MDYLLGSGQISDEEVGKSIGMSREAVTRRKKRSGYQSLLQTSLNVTQDNLKNIFRRSISELELLLNDPDPRVRIAAVSLALKFMPEKPATVVTQEILSDLVKQPGFFDELFKIPGVGHHCIMMAMSKIRRD